MAKISNLFRKKERDPNAPKAPRKKMSKKKKVFLVIGVILLAVVVFFIFRGCGAKKVSNTTNTAKVERGDISVIISGTGTIEANDQYDVTSLVKGTVLSAPFEEGQQVNKGDVLYTIDTEDMQNSIEKSKNALEKSRLTYEQTQESIDNLNITAPISGVVTNKYVKEGDSVSNGGQIVDIVDNSVMILNIPFNSSDISNIYVGASAQVTLENTSYPLSGSVSRIATGSTISDEGVNITTVQIEVENPGAIKAGDKATALVNGVACNSSGSFDNNESTTVRAKTGGDVDWISVEVGDKVTAGQKIVQLESQETVNQQKSNELSLQDAQLSIDNLYTQLEDYTITAPISGTVVKKTTKAGDNLEQTTTQEVMATIADMSRILFKINVDELDIAKIEVGQEVSVTADALPDQTFTGYVDYISVVGNTTNGVTTYPVTVVVNEPEGLIPGMNVDADILVESKENVLTVPVSAIKRGNLVTVKDPSASAVNSVGEPQANTSDSIPAGFKNVEVQIGLSNNDMVEIISGLNEGDEVLIPEVETKSVMEMMMSAPMGGGGGGEPPQGGGPGGGQGGGPSGGGGAQ